MRNYLSFGGGVNSVALHLHLLDQGDDFESVFVHHGTDWPETYDYVAGFQWWLKTNGHRPITVLRPDAGTTEGERFSVLYDYYHFKKIFPVRAGGALGSGRTCTHRFKIQVVHKYVEKPCFLYIGIDFDEIRRATGQVDKGVEKRYPLIEAEITRGGCIELIKGHGLPAPPKSGCYICPFQSDQEYKRLRMEYPNLFCKVEQLENRYIERRKNEGKVPLYIKRKAPIRKIIDEDQLQLFEKDEYPPCQCGL